MSINCFGCFGLQFSNRGSITKAYLILCKTLQKGKLLQYIFHNLYFLDELDCLVGFLFQIGVMGKAFFKFFNEEAGFLSG